MSATQVAAHLTPLELFEQADIIVKSILVLLTLASLVSWGVIIDKLLRFARLRRNAISWTAALAGQRSLGKLAQELKQQTQDPFARIYHAIVDEWHITHRQQLQVGPQGQQLHHAAQAAGANHSTFRQLIQRSIIIGDKRIARIFALQYSGQRKPLRQLHRHILERMYGQVGAPLGHRHFKFFNKQALATHFGQCAIQNLITSGRHSDNFDIALRI